MNQGIKNNFSINKNHVSQNKNFSNENSNDQDNKECFLIFILAK